MRFVIDTNLLVSGVLFRGLPRQLLNAARAGVFELCSSDVLLAELEDVLGRGKFVQALTQAGLTPLDIVAELRRLALVVSPTHVPRAVPTDPDDDHVLAAALCVGADLIVSGDRRDLLPMASYEGIPIVSARQAWEHLGLPSF
ncbi:putative toxin-antitoxin system toxin component, PIN family [uncultured Pseudacidovorax sp.]|uniref:putative toxin-antitoxin system toxin component, PIN family n=1 Tax=uncultured Pseudacidovorax sp. TaxID=679313 RepID=UPI0025E5D347|nr:putative toxin-antitoxin system toxin component, PIN family [uncultured Pseudacidovorax sp.]